MYLRVVKDVSLSDPLAAGVLGHWDMMAIEQFRMAGWRSQGSGGPTRLLIMDWQRLLPTVTELYGALYQISMLHACQLLRAYGEWTYRC